MSALAKLRRFELHMYTARVGVRVVLVVLLLAGCGRVGFDVTNRCQEKLILPGVAALVVVVNPVLNDASTTQIAASGSSRRGVQLALDTGIGAVTDDEGVAILRPVAAGSRTLTLAGAVDGTVRTEFVPEEVTEIAVTADAGAETLIELEYALGNPFITLTPDSAGAEIRDALATNGAMVLFEDGAYEVGNVENLGNGVTLIGDAVCETDVVIRGNIKVSGTTIRIRGILLDGNLDISGSSVTVAFSTVTGTTTASGSTVRLLQNHLCGPADFGTSIVTALGNTGLAPLATTCP